jgi:fermentation-respiration switch protein FrsA (DUF1100 family)
MIVELLISLVRIFVLVLLGYAAVLFFVQRSLVFPGVGRDPPRAGRSPPADAKQVWLATSFGEVEAWFFQAEGTEVGPALLFAHGNGEFIDDWAEEMASLPELGLGVLLVEFPGYGLSHGKPSRATIRESFQVAFDWLLARREVDRGRIAVWGRSLGGGAAGDLTRDRPVAALVLQSTFTSTPKMAWETFRAPSFLVRDQWDNLEALQGFGGPVLLMHGRADDVIPFSHAEELAGVREDLAVEEIPCAHNDCSPAWSTTREIVRQFLVEHGLL